jgi:hypothetical protein
MDFASWYVWVGHAGLRSYYTLVVLYEYLADQSFRARELDGEVGKSQVRSAHREDTATRFEPVRGCLLFLRLRDRFEQWAFG